MSGVTESDGIVGVIVIVTGYEGGVSVLVSVLMLKGFSVSESLGVKVIADIAGDGATFKSGVQAAKNKTIHTENMNGFITLQADEILFFDSR